MSNKYEAILDGLNSKEIYLNINLLEQGNYQLKIVDNNKVINTTHFRKQ